MATLCDVGFNLVIYYYKRGCKEKLIVRLTKNLENLLEKLDEYTVHISENTTYELEFTAQDSKARLYIEGIDGTEGSYYDRKYEQSYILPSNDPVVWFRWDVSDRGMIPGSYYIKVSYYGEWYYGVLQIDAKHIENEQLNQMKEEVEAFLSKWKTLPLGIQESIEEKYLYNQGNDEQKQIKILMKWYSKIMILISDFKRSPYEQIEKAYHYGPKEANKKSDQTAIRMSLKRTGDPNKVVSYTKSMSYETQENRWVKSFNERLLMLVMKLQQSGLEPQQEATLKKISAICQQLKNCQWYQNIECRLYEELPIRSRYDSRYRTLFQFDHELWQSIRLVGLKRTKAYLWLETAWVYELWCFQKVYQQLIKELGYEEIGTVPAGFVLAKGDRVLKLHYDTMIPIYSNQTNKNTCPLYARSPIHRRPDGRIDIYNLNQYCGSIILEFKYSNYYHVWNENRETRCSEQLLNYGYQLASSYLDNVYNLPEQVMQKINPIQKVIVIMPKLKGGIHLIEDKETNIVQVGLSPEENNVGFYSYIETVIDKSIG